MEAVLLQLGLFDLASRQAEWLSARQKVISQNVANSDTPGYSGKDVQPFLETLGSASTKLLATNPGHFDEARPLERKVATNASTSQDVTHSGNTVSLDEQMLKANEVRSAYSLNAGVIKTFNRMILASLKG